MPHTELTTIEVVEENKEGHDFFATDFHGMYDSFQELLALLNANPKNRLFIGGDLIDRGKDGDSIIEKIIAINEASPYKKIYAIKGNHEIMALNSIQIMENILIEIAKLNLPDNNKAEFFLNTLAENEDYILHHESGGVWLTELYLKEYLDNKVKVIITESSETATDKVYKVIYSDSSEVIDIKNYITSLPYIIKVNGASPFLTVHADMLITDEELDKRTSRGEELTEEECYYLVTERVYESAPSQSRRDKDSCIVYCGHTPFFLNGASVREETSSVNTDTACYVTNIVIVINHTLKRAQLVGDVEKLSEEYKKKLNIQLEKINLFLAKKLNPQRTVDQGFFKEAQPKRVGEESKTRSGKRFKPPKLQLR